MDEGKTKAKESKMILKKSNIVVVLLLADLHDLLLPGLETVAGHHPDPVGQEEVSVHVVPGNGGSLSGAEIIPGRHHD